MADNETTADIIAEMRRGTRLPGYWHSCDVNKILQYHADRLDAAHRRERGDCAKLRKALEQCANWGEQIDCQLGSSDETVYAFRDERCLAHNISECARAALAAPPRNCDRGTADEQAKRMDDFCARHGERIGCSWRCDNCPLCSINRCDLVWAQMPYEKEARSGTVRTKAVLQ